MTTISISVRVGDDDTPFDPAVIGALMGTEQTLRLADATFPATVTGIDIRREGRTVHLTFEAAEVTCDPAILTAPPAPQPERRGRFRRSA